jgi:RNA polymerase sigma factor for flagellar operon FliA
MTPETAQEQRFREALPIIDAVTRALGRRYRLSRDEEEEFAATVRLRLIDDDYAVLRRFEERSRLSTFLRTVITRQFLDDRVRAWGRWRPSAEAVRLGPTAVALERLVEQQRLSFEEAIETLRARDASLDVETLRDLAARLPGRVTGRRLMEIEAIADMPASDPAPDELLEAREAAATAAATSSALKLVLAGLPPRERLLLRLRFEQGTTVANIARVLGEEQKPLYRQLERLLGELRRELERLGVSAAHVRTLTHLPHTESGEPGGNPIPVAVSQHEHAGRGPVAG